MSAIFDQLRISDDGKMLYLDVHVNEASYFERVTLYRVIIKTSDQVSETDPLNPIGDNILNYKAEEDSKELHLALKASVDFEQPFTTLSDKLLFVYVICEGAPDPCTPCRLDEMTTLGVTFDVNLLYQRVMGYTKDLVQDCTVPVGFADFILLWSAFKAAVETEHYVPAIKFWNMLFEKGTDIPSVVGIKPCGCHG